MKTNNMQFIYRLYNVQYFSVNMILYIFAFFYFVTLSGDKLNISVGLFSLKLTNIFSFLFLTLFFYFKKIFFVDKKTFFSFLLLSSSFFISSFFSPMIYRSMVYLVVFLSTILIYFYVPMNIVICFDEKKILSIYSASFIFIGCYAILQFILFFCGIRAPFLGQMLTSKVARASAFSYEPSYYALYMVPFVIFQNTKFFLSKDFSVKRFSFVFFINFLLIISTSTGILFSYLLFGLIMFCFFCSRKIALLYKSFRQKFLICFSSFIVFIGIIGFLLKDLFKASFLKFFYQGLSHFSFLDRWEGLVLCWNIFMKYPIFGVGVGGVPPYLWKQCCGSNINLESLSGQEIKVFEPTNVLTEILASLGTYGAICFAVFFIAYFSCFFQALKKKNLSLKQRKNILAMIVSLIVMGFTLQFSQNIFRCYIWVHSAICYAYVYKINTKEEQVFDKQIQ